MSVIVQGNTIVTGNTLIGTYTPLADLYSGAIAGYSVRKLRSAYTGSALRVRRSSDNVEQDIGFNTYGNLDESALTAFIGANSGYVSTWYDQIGSANLTNPSFGGGRQPQIVSSGSIIKQGGRPAPLFLGNWHSLSGVSTTSFPGTLDMFVVLKSAGQGQRGWDQYPVEIGSSSVFELNTNSGGISVWRGTWYSISATVENTPLIVNVGLLGASGYLIGANNSITTSATNLSLSGSYTITLGVRTDAGYGFYGPISEVVMFGANKSTDRSAIRTNMNYYYSVY